MNKLCSTQLNKWLNTECSLILLHSPKLFSNGYLSSRIGFPHEAVPCSAATLRLGVCPIIFPTIGQKRQLTFKLSVTQPSFNANAFCYQKC